MSRQRNTTVARQHADPDTAIYFAPTPTDMIRRLLPLVPTDATIASYVSNHFGLPVTIERVAKMRAKAERENRKIKQDSEYSALGEPIGITAGDRTRRADAVKGSQGLIEAVRAAKERSR